ncbi:MAG: cytidine deaminase [Flavobacteriia bacterium]|jgi:cytidine deaminase
MNYRHQIDYELYEDWHELSDSDIALIDQAYVFCNQAYAPYSNFKVAAVLLLDDGSVVKGNNQENMAYPSGLCAERVALFFAGANFPTKKVKAIYIVAQGELLNAGDLLSPCGGCRQVMLETELRQNTEIKVFLVSQNNKTMVFSSAKDLLPMAFGSI